MHDTLHSLIPPVERVRPGLWSIPVPLPFNSLRYVLVYAFETDAGPYIVDVGWNTDEAYEALDAGLAHFGASVGDVRGVLVTHIHPDHYGLAGRVRQASGAWVALHPADAELIDERYERPEKLVEEFGAMLAGWGVPDEKAQLLKNISMPLRALVDTAAPDILVEDGDRPDIPGWDVTAIWTPGHSPGHLCFWEAANEVMISGDHVLPRITPNIPFHPQACTDPLGDYLDSLRRLRQFQVGEVLPAHEYRFADMYARIDELVAYHEARFAEVVDAVADGVDTVWGIAGRIKWSRPLDDSDVFTQRIALTEAMAHVRALEERGRVAPVPVEPGEPLRWRLVEAA